MMLYSFIGVAVTSASLLVFPDILIQSDAPWDPVGLIARFDNPVVVVLAMFALAIATLTTNIAANVVSPANDFSNVAPRHISYRLGGYITAAIGLVIMPWKLMEGYVFVWLNGYGALLGPIGGILVADYWILRRRVLVVEDLYRRGGAYEYTGGVNLAALAALAAGVAPNVPGFLHATGLWPTAPEVFAEIYHYTWFTGFALAAAVYLGLMAVARKS
jgi:nucleobase:cation symporter-1, NCS1 family